MLKELFRVLKFAVYKQALKRKGISMGRMLHLKNTEFVGPGKIEDFCRFVGVEKIKIGRNFYFNANCHLLGEIEIGNNVMVGPQTVIWSRDHGTAAGTPMNSQPLVSKKIIIGDDVWIGAHVTILKGVRIGNGCVIGAGAVVTKNIPDCGIAMGNPAEVVRFRDEAKDYKVSAENPRVFQ